SLACLTPRLLAARGLVADLDAQRGGVELHGQLGVRHHGTESRARHLGQGGLDERRHASPSGMMKRKPSCAMVSSSMAMSPVLPLSPGPLIFAGRPRSNTQVARSCLSPLITLTIPS